MKVASSSAAFAEAIARGELTQLEWLDLCANELEVDGVVFDGAQFPRRDADYVAQLKKFAADLGLTVAALAADAFAEDGGEWFQTALALGAPLLISKAPPSNAEPSAWGELVDVAKTRVRQAKLANITLAVRNVPATLCASEQDLRLLAKDVDSAWLRYALDPTALGATDSASALLGKTAIAIHTIDDVTRFASPEDSVAPHVNASLARFRGFVLLETTDAHAPRDAYHHAVERFYRLRARALSGDLV